MDSFSVWHWIILGMIVFLLYRVFVDTTKSNVYCRACGETGKPVTHTPGNLLIEIILWLCFIVPGLIYSIWRHSARATVCGNCKSKEVIPTDSPAAVAAKRQAAGEGPDATVRCPDCREVVRADARKCKHCGTALTPATASPLAPFEPGGR